jgi:hypothetical protein
LEYRDGLGVKITNDAEGFVIGCLGTADEALHAVQYTRRRLKLTANETKARLGRVLDGPFDFLGYAIGHGYSPKTGRAFGTDPGEEDGYPALSGRQQFQRSPVVIPAL